MRLYRLALVDFRNCAAAELSLDPGTNVLVGPNGAGKTNVLEAVHLLTTGFSNRAARDQEMVRWGSRAFAVRGTAERDALPGDLVEWQVTYVAGQGKTVTRAGKALTGVARAGALGGAVIFSPDDLALVKGAPALRRAYVDLACAKAVPAYRGLWRRYAGALAHRNRLLGSAGRMAPASLAQQLKPWTAQLVATGAEVVAHRLRALMLLIPLAAAAYVALAGPGEELEARYVNSASAAGSGGTSDGAPGPSSVAGPAPVAALAAELALAYEREAGQEVMRGVTLVGPHRDDVELTLNGSSLRTFGSQGQQRTAALALRLAENEYLCRVRQDTPLLLLDDVFSELDESRRGALLALLGRRAGGAQTFLAATDVQNLPPLAVEHAALFRVEGGVVSLAHGAV